MNTKVSYKQLDTYFNDDASTVDSKKVSLVTNAEIIYLNKNLFDMQIWNCTTNLFGIPQLNWKYVKTWSGNPFASWWKSSWPVDIPDNLVNFRNGSSAFSGSPIIKYANNINAPNLYNMYHMFAICNNLLKGIDAPNVINMAYAYCNCHNLLEASCGDKVTNLDYAFYGCNNLEQAVCGNNVVTMVSAYQNCSNLRYAACGPNVINMDNAFGPYNRLVSGGYAYYGISTLEKAVCGDKVRTMFWAYYGSGIRGEAACGKSVVELWETYANCHNLEKANCGPNVVKMYNTYDRCYNLKGEAACGDKVINMYGAYRSCRNLTTANVGPNVINMAYAYVGCNNLLYSACGDNVINMYSAFGVDDRYYYGFCQNLLTACCGPKVQDMTCTYEGCHNLREINMSDSVRYCIGAFYSAGSSYPEGSVYFQSTDAICPPKVLDLSNTYPYCNLIKNAACSDNVINMVSAYQGSSVITAACGKNVINMSNAYSDCHFLKEANIGNNVIDASNAFAYCYNLTSTDYGANVKYMNRTFMRTRITDLTIGPNVINIERVAWHANYYDSVQKREVYTLRTISIPQKTLEFTSIAGCFASAINVEPIDVSNFISHSRNYQESFSGVPVIGDLHIAATNINADMMLANNYEAQDTERNEYSLRINIHCTPKGCQNFQKFPVWMQELKNHKYNIKVSWSELEDGNGYYNSDANIWLYNNYKPVLNYTSDELRWSNVCQDPCEIGYVSDNIVNFSYGYYNSYLMTGKPKTSANAVDMSYAYYNCTQLEGNPVAGPMVNNLYYAYADCPNVYGDMYLYRATHNDCNIVGCFKGRDNSRRLNIHCVNTYYAGGWCDRILSQAITTQVLTWTKLDDADGYFNEAENLYLYCDISDDQTVFIHHQNQLPYNFMGNVKVILNDTIIPIGGYDCFHYRSTKLEKTRIQCSDMIINLDYSYSDWKNDDQPMCGKNVVTMYSTYRNCQNITYSPVCGPNVQDFRYTYYLCLKLAGPAVCGDKVTNMVYAYYNCRSLNGSAACGDNVINMAYAYYDCRSLNGSAACGDNVTDMYWTYYNCISLNGLAACGDNVRNMSYAYYNCFNLIGEAACGDKVTNMYNTYTNCFNLTGEAACGDKVTNMYGAYTNCHNLTTANVGPNVINMAYAYKNCISLTNIKISNSVENMSEAYNNSGAIEGLCGPNVIDMSHAYRYCHYLTYGYIGPKVSTSCNYVFDGTAIKTIYCYNGYHNIIAPYSTTLTNVYIDHLRGSVYRTACIDYKVDKYGFGERLNIFPIRNDFNCLNNTVLTQNVYISTNNYMVTLRNTYTSSQGVVQKVIEDYKIIEYNIQDLLSSHLKLKEQEM